MSLGNGLTFSCDYLDTVISQGNYRADQLVRLGTTIQLSEEFATTGIPLGTFGYFLVSAITNSADNRWGHGQTERKIWPRHGLGTLNE